MNKAKLISLVAVLVISQQALANGPCLKIKAACEAAGYTKGGHQAGHGLWKDCVQKLKKGQTVQGVVVDPSDVTACKEKAAARHAKRQ